MNLKDYIRGQRQGKEANQLERKAMDDPFLMDAIDGYDSVEGNHISTIEELEKRLSSPQKRINRRIWIWAAAAVIVLLIGIPLLLLKPDMKDDTTVASSDITIEKKEADTPLLKDDTVLLADHHRSNKIEDTTPKVKQVPSPTFPNEVSRQITDDIETAGNINEIESVANKDILVTTTQPVTERMLIKEPQKEIQGRVAGVTISQPERAKRTYIRGSSTSITQPNTIAVSGRVVDEIGEPIAGATIILQNSRSGAITDTAGNFQLTVPKDEQGTLIASFIGMKNSEIPLKENLGDIMMKADDMALNEVVVVGHGIQRKEKLAGAVSMIQENQIFGEKEFKEYFGKNYDKDICAGQNTTIVVEFFIDPIGRPSQINIKENSCPALENEIKRLLLGSPPWSKTNRKVTIQIEVP